MTQIIDSHVHVCGPPQEAEPRNLVALMRKSYIQNAIVFRYVYGQPTMVGNQAVWAATRAYPDELIGFAWIDPQSESALDEMEKAISIWNFKGIKIHMEIHAPSPDQFRDVVMGAKELSVPVCIHMGDDPTILDKIAREDKVRIIVAHLGTGVYNLDTRRLENAVNLAKRHKNIYLETSGNTYFFVEYAVRKVGAEKIIFGSDFPHEHPLVMVRAIELLDLPQRETELILAGNILGLISSA
jgi:predicted TIM-barrel fold metal-dependent hydrolase